MATPDEIRDQIEQLNEELSRLNESFKSISAEIFEEIDGQIKNMVDAGERRAARSARSQLTTSIKGMEKSLAKQAELRERISKGENVSKELNKEQNKYSRLSAEREQSINALKAKGLSISDRLLEDLQENSKETSNQLEGLEGLNEAERKRLGLTGQLGSVIEGFAKKIDKSGTLSDALDIQGARRNAGSLPQFFGNIGKNIASNINKADIGLAILKKVGDTLLEIDQETANLQRGFAVTKNEAIGINQELARGAISANTLGVNLESVTKATNDLNKALGGTNNLFSREIRNEVAFLQERLKLSDEAATSLAMTAITTGKAVGEVREEQEAVFLAVQDSTGVALKFQQTLEEANKVSGALRLNMDALPGGIVEATAVAKSLGLELDQIKGIQSGILDFESSIAAELEAELLTGKQLNLERARLAALNNDIVTLTEEIASQFGSVAEFQSMNYIQQQAFAKSVGMTSDQLADTLRKQTAINESIESGVKSKNKDLSANASALSAQEALTQSIKSLNTTLKTSLFILLGLAGIAAILMAPVTGGASLLALGKIAAIGGAVGAGAQLVGDGIAPSSKGPFTITDSYGGMAITAKGDSILASPNITNSATSAGNSEQSRTNALLERLLAKDSNVYMDSDKVGSAFAKNATF